MINARRAYNAENFEGALQAYSKVREQEPDNLEATEGLARTHYRLRHFDQALAYGDEALEKNSSLVWPHLIRSYIYYLQKEMDKCKDEARVAIEAAPEDWETNFWWGSILDFEHDTDKGLAFLEKAAAMQTGNWYLYNNLSSAYLNKREYQKYYNALENMNRLKPSALLTVGVYVGRREKAFRVIAFAIHYVLIVFALVFRTPALLIAPAVIDAGWLVLGAVVFTRNRRAGIFYILIAIWSSLFVLGAYLVLR